MTRRNISVAQRLAIGFGTIVFLLVLNLLFIKRQQERSALAQTTLTERIKPRQVAAWDVERSMLYLGISVRNCLISQEAPCAERLAASVQQTRASVAALDRLPKDPDGEAVYEPVPTLIEQYISIADSLRRNPPAAFADGEAALREARDAALVRLRDYGQLQLRKGDSATVDVARAREIVTQTLGLSLVLCTAVALLVGLLTIQSIQRPTRELVDVADAMRRGDWNRSSAWARLRFPGSVDGASAAEGSPHTVRNEFLRIGTAFAAAGVAVDTRERELHARSRVATATGSSLDVHDVASQALTAIAEYVGADVGIVHLLNRNGLVLSPIAARGIPNGDTLAVGTGVPGMVAREGSSALVTDIPANTPFTVRLGFDNAPVAAVFSVPVTFADSTIAVITLGALHPFSLEQQRFVESAATQLGIGLQNVRTHAELQNLLAQVTQQREQIQLQFEQLQAQTEELQAQHEQIQAQNEELQAQGEEILAQNAQLQQQAHSLTEADAQKNDFLGLLAHELRNPLAAVSNSVYLLASSADGNERSRRACAVIERQTRQLTRLIDDLLDITRVSRGMVTLDVTDVDLSAIVGDCIADHRAAFERQSLQVETVMPESSLHVRGDSTRLAQIVGNLVDNAVKFTEPGGRIKIRLMSDGAFVQLVVKDTGIGVSPELLPRLFLPFVQADLSRTRNSGGLGLGLALVDAFTRLHGGTVTAVSEGPGMGTTLTVTLPRLAAVAPTFPNITMSAHHSSPARRLRVLIIEDNPDAAESLRDVLSLEGHRVHIATDVADGLRCVHDLRPELVLCDVGLPDRDGYDFARSVRADPNIAATYLVALTGYAAANDRALATAAGFDQHLSKPATVDAVRQVLALVASERAPSSS